ncbi:MAG: hypothetical protein ACXVA9_02465 [Bdellovibrionales bacterium]
MSDVPVWNCEFAPMPEAGTPDLASLTVGAKFAMKCHGDIAVAWEPGNPHLAFSKPEEQYTLAILQVVKQDPNDAQYVVTAYKPGEHQPEFVRVLQGAAGSEKGFESAKPKWAVKSVLDPKQPPQAFGPFGPWSLHMPMWFIVSAVIFLALLIYFVVRKARRMSQRRKMLEELKLHKTAMAPLHQFYRDARLLRRRLHTVKERSELQQISQDLDRDFRLFVLRQFQIPTLQWSNRAILEDLRRRHRKTYKTSSEPLKKTLRELDKMKSRSELDAKDVEQVYRMSLDAAEKLETAGGRS